MSRQGSSYRGCVSGLSHASGNDPVAMLDLWIMCQFIPRMWEWVDSIIEIMEKADVYPMRVGMNRTDDTTHDEAIVYPTQVEMSRKETGAEAWGCSLSHACGNESGYKHFLILAPVGYPARVGMNRTVLHSFSWDSVLSHASWNESRRAYDERMQNQFIPHVWEWAGHVSLTHYNTLVYPTWVGMSRSVEAYAEWLLCLSHVSGSESIQ